MASATFSSGGAGGGGQPDFPDSITRIVSITESPVTHIVTAGKYAIVTIQGSLGKEGNSNSRVEATIAGTLVFSISYASNGSGIESAMAASSAVYMADAGEQIVVKGATTYGAVSAEIREYTK